MSPRNCVTEIDNRFVVADWTCSAMRCGREVEPGERYKVVCSRFERFEGPVLQPKRRYVARVAHAGCWPSEPPTTYVRPDEA